MLGHEEVVEPESIGEDALANLIDQRALRAGVDLGERSVIHGDAARRVEHGKIARAVMKDSDFKHVRSPLRRSREKRGSELAYVVV